MNIFKSKKKLLKEIKELKEIIKSLEEAWDYSTMNYVNLSTDFGKYMAAKQQVEESLRMDYIKELNKNAELEQELIKLKESK